jgi:hypothetical protein
MRTFNSIQDLVEKLDELPDVGWLFVDKNFDCTSRTDIASKKFFLAETDDDEINGLRIYKTWLEAPTFSDIVLSRRETKPDADINEITEAAIYYLENDSFI